MRTCFLLLSISILLLSCGNASLITVGEKDADYTTIQKAIDNSSDGDVIEVHSGVYHENVILYKQLTLLGVDSGSGRPVLDAGGSGSVISISANDSVVRGFNVTGSGGCGCGNAGIKIGSSNNIVEDNIIYNNKYGIYIQPYVTNNTMISNDLLDNSITASDNGVESHWNASVEAGGFQGLIELLSGPDIRGNHYSDFDEEAEGCFDANSDGICDGPKRIGNNGVMDSHASKSKMN